MRIAEISTPEIRQSSVNNHGDGDDDEDNHQHQSLLSQLETTIKQIESLSSFTTTTTTNSDSLATDLRQTLTKLTQLAPFPKNLNSLKLHIWKLSYRLWNTCVDFSNAKSLRSHSSSYIRSENIATLRHIAADLLYLAVDVTGVPSPTIKAASFYHKTGLIWHDLRNFDLASNCFDKATDLLSKIDVSSINDSNERKLLFELNLARSRTAWEVDDRSLAVILLNRSKVLLFGLPEHYKILATQYLTFGKIELSKNENQSLNEALKLINQALELCEKGFCVAKTQQEIVGLKDLRSTTLRFISAVHLQQGEYESVIKCVKVLREGVSGVANDAGGDCHASLPVLAMKAWLGLGRYNEAETELRGMVANKGVPESVWVSAVEAYFQAAGTTTGAETVKSVFLGLLGRCHVSAKSAVRVVHRLIGGNNADGGVEGLIVIGAKVRAKVASDLVSDERVVALFGGENVVKERTSMHAVLWNCASEHFRLKDYETSAEMFEKAMLYIPHDIDNRIMRTKGYRVLCLCYLGLSQFDRAQEYINEAEKLEPNIACAFLKFKIYLQKNDYTNAINQIQAMTTCLDFTPDFLSLSAHEAVACHALPVAVAALSNILNFYASCKSMPTSEVVILRTLITILNQDPGKQPEVLKYMKQAQARVSELGPDYFFGKGNVGHRERNWFAVTSWNYGTTCGKEKKYELCAEFLNLASEFYDVRVDDGEGDENRVMVCKSLIMTVSAMIASENQNKTALTDTQVKRAAELLDRAGKILFSISSATSLCNDKMSTNDPDLFFIYTFNAYEIQGRLNNLQSQLLLVTNYTTSKSCKPSNLLQIGLLSLQGPRFNPEVASYALNECLSTLLSHPSPDYQTVALIIRKLIVVASIHKGETEDEAVLNMYKRAYRLMLGLKEGDYPTEEGKWLAVTAWNRAALPVRLGQVDVAKKWMSIGLEIAKQVSGTETYRACMEDFAAGFENLGIVNNIVAARPQMVI
ncbi:hypothetical protein ACFE04_000409 [Oxalis oulophora]